MKYQQKFTAESSLAKLAKIRSLLSERPMSVRELTHALPADARTVHAYIKHVRASVHVARWDRVGPRSYPAAVYAWGVGRDAKKPEPAGKNDARRKRRREARIDPELFMEAEKAKKAAQIRPFRDPMIEAMYGKAA